MGRKSYNFRLVSEEVNDRLSGYLHNAVCPLALAVDLPMIISDKLVELPQKQFWLGGGHVDLKLRVDAEEFVKVFGAVSALITSPDEGDKPKEDAA